LSKTALIAVGGNSLIRAGEKGTVAEQLANTRRTAEGIVRLIEHGYGIVVTHGNGPQVGAALLRSERASDQVYVHTLDVCDATTQGEIGYLMQQSLYNAMAARGLSMPVATVLTQAVVSPEDPAFQAPTKPIGPFYSKGDDEERKRTLGWEIVEDAARGYRRVVASPEPIDIVEEPVIKRLIAGGVLVIAVGGGGVPVTRQGVALKGAEAVIDKDRASALLAGRLGVDEFIISTDVPCAYLDYKKPTERAIQRATVSEIERHHEAGQFQKGSMGPKVESAIRFVRGGGREAIITSYEYLWDAVQGTAGTHVVPDSAP
jgi:carbamate kinase